MKKLLIAVVCMFSVASFAQDLKFGHVNTQDLIALMPEFQTAQKEIEDTRLMYVNEMQKLENEFQSKYSALQQEAEKLDPAIRASRTAEVEKMYENMQNFQQTAQENLQKKQMELMIPITDKAKKAIAQVGEEMKLIYVFDMQEGTPILYHSAQSIDILPAVKKKLGL